MVKLAVPPASVVTNPLVVDKMTPLVSSSVLSTLTSSTGNPSKLPSLLDVALVNIVYPCVSSSISSSAPCTVTITPVCQLIAFKVTDPTVAFPSPELLELKLITTSDAG